MTSDPYTVGLALIVAAAAILAGLAAAGVVHQLRRRDARPATTPPPVPATEVVHTGADERYADDLRAAKATVPSAELRTIGEQMVVDHDALAGIGHAIDEFDQHMSEALRRFLRATPAAYVEVTRWGSRTIADTGQLDAREIAAAGQQRELAGAGAR